MGFGLPSSEPVRGIGDNSPPLEAVLLDDFATAVAFRESNGKPLLVRIDELLASAGRATATDPETAGRCTDLVKMIRAANDAVEEERMKLNRPVLVAQKALMAAAEKLKGPLVSADGEIRRKLQKFDADERAKRDEEARKAREEARQAAADQKAADDARRAQAEAVGATYVPPEPVVEPERIAEPEKPVVKGDYGAKLSSTTKWVVEVQSWELALTALASNDKVREAAQKVLNQMAKGGQRQIAGCRVVSESGIAIR